MRFLIFSVFSLIVSAKNFQAVTEFMQNDSQMRDLRFDELELADYVDIPSYMGLWYEVKRIPNDFEEGCFNVTATYTLRWNGTVKVENSCTEIDGSTHVGKAIGRVVNKQNNAELAVNFIPIIKYLGWFGNGDYNILYIDEDYQYALVGSKDREYLWILARSLDVPAAVVDYLTEIAERNGFDTSRWIVSPQL